jgi:NADH:ubiquinone oxidoreductase subunit 4 (subunit M)
VAEFLTFLGAWRSAHPWWLFPAVAGTLLTAVYILRVVKQIFWGPPPTQREFHDLPDAQGPEWVTLVLLIFCLVLFGTVPGIALGLVDSATVPLLARLGIRP